MILFFKYNCQPRGYISEGERTIDNQSEQAATLHMITTRVILPQFTMIGHNKLRIGTCTRYTHYREIEDEKAETSSRGIEPATLRSTSDLVLHLANDASGFVFSGISAPW